MFVFVLNEVKKLQKNRTFEKDFIIVKAGCFSSSSSSGASTLKAQWFWCPECLLLADKPRDDVYNDHLTTPGPSPIIHQSVPVSKPIHMCGNWAVPSGVGSGAEVSTGAAACSSRALTTTAFSLSPTRYDAHVHIHVHVFRWETLPHSSVWCRQDLFHEDMCVIAGAT